MTLVGFQKSVRMFRKFSEETQRRRGGSELGREGVAALIALEAVVDGKRLFDGTLIEPLSAFTNLLQSSLLPPDFGDYSFGDALLAIERAHEQVREGAEQRWEFATELGADDAAKVHGFWRKPSASDADREHGIKLRRFVLDAAHAADSGSALVCGALSGRVLPLSYLAEFFRRLIFGCL